MCHIAHGDQCDEDKSDGGVQPQLSLPVFQSVDAFKYLGLHFHASGDISHIITPLKAKAAGSWAVVQQRHSQLQCGNAVNLKLFLLQSILVPSLHYGCELWRMHAPLARQIERELLCSPSMTDRHIRGVKYATPSAMLLEELGLSPLQGFWWRRTLEYWNRLAASPVGSLFHTMSSKIDDAFSVGRGARNFSGSIAACLQSIGQSMPVYSGIVPNIVGTVVEALRLHLDGTHDYALHCPRAAPSVGIVACTYHHWFKPFSRHRRYF